MGLEIREALDRFDYALCVQIRTQVFVIGQQVPADREIDRFENESRHYLAARDEVAVGTVRWRLYSEGTAKIERLAVLAAARGRQTGSKLMEHALNEMKTVPTILRVTLGSQDHAIPFYAALGFEVDGASFIDVGIPHHTMVRRLQPW